MFSGLVVGILVGLSAAAWIYSKTMRRTGNNTQSSLIMAGIFGFITFVVIWIIMGMVDSSLS